MAKVKIQGNASGTGILTVTAPNTSTDRTITLPDATGTLATTADSVGGATGVDFNDNVKARFGTGNDLEIYHSGSHSIINETGDGYLIVQTDGTGMLFQKGTTEDMAKFLIDGAVELYHDNSKKFETTATGVAVTGGVAIGGTAAANTLDDYEEGTWTPQLATASTDLSQSGQSGHYTKIGNVVYCMFSVSVSALNSASGMLQIHDLPFTVTGVAYGGAEACSGEITFANNLRSVDYGGGVVLRCNNSTSYIECKYSAGGSTTQFGGTDFNVEDINSNTFMCGNFMYLT